MAESFPNRTQVPNIVDDMGLDPYERALYVHYKRVCGENQGAYCFEATKTTAQKVKMSMGQVSESRKQLALKGLIIVQKGQPIVVTVVNIWEMNTAFYQLEHRPDIDGWTVEQVKLWLSDVHTVNLTTHNHSNMVTRSETNLTYCDDSVHTVNEDSHSENLNGSNDNMSSGVHTVKQRSKESLLEESNPSKESNRVRVESRAHVKPEKVLKDHKELALKLISLCGYVDPKFVVNGKMKECADSILQLVEWEVTPALLCDNEFGAYWWGTGPPTFKQVVENWGKFLEWRQKPREPKNGATSNGHKQPKDTRPAFERSGPPTQDDIAAMLRGSGMAGAKGVPS